MPHPADIARKVLEIESQAILDLIPRVDASFTGAVELILCNTHRLVVTGMGKSGIIARKIAATFSSTGTPAVFLHPAEAIHGDLGMVSKGDLVLALSNSGETEELIRLIPYLQENQIPYIAFTGKITSTLAQYAQLVIDVSVEKEACPLQLAPTASTTASLAMGDALAMAVMEMKGFQPENFAGLHPGGNLGRRLLTRVHQVMRTQDLPVLLPDAEAPLVIHRISAGRLGLVVVEESGLIQGIVTDGDVRRAMEKHLGDFFSFKAADLMTASPLVISPEARLVEAELIMRERKVTSLLVAEGQHLQGVIQIYDLSL